jgi:hypothetical protein
MQNPWKQIPDVWADSWTVVLCNDHKTEEHVFVLSHRASSFLGKDRAEQDAKDFACDFGASARVMYCGRTKDMPKHLKQEIAEHHYCE